MKAKHMNNVEQFISKLQDVKWTHLDDKKCVGSIGSFEVKISLYTEVTEHQNLPLQAIMYVRFNDNVVAHWGAVDNDDNYKLVSYYNGVKRTIRKSIDEQKRISEKHAQSMYDAI